MCFVLFFLNDFLGVSLKASQVQNKVYFNFLLIQSLLLLFASLFLCTRTADVIKQNVLNQGKKINSTEPTQTINGSADIAQKGCTEPISLPIKPCFCKDVVQKYSKNNASTSDVNMREIWLYCGFMNLEDDQMSRILTAFLSSE